MNDIRIKNLVFNILSFIPLDEDSKKTVATNPSILNSLLEMPTIFINWTPRVKHALEENNIKKMRDLINKLEKLKQFRNFGAVSYREVIRKLSKLLKKYLGSESYRTTIDQLVNKPDYMNVYLDKSILGEIIYNKIPFFSKISSDNGKLLKFLSTPIWEIEWSVRTSNALREAKIKKVGDFNKFDELDLLALRNFGKKSLSEVYTQLVDFIKKFIQQETSKIGFSREFRRMVSSDNLVDFVKYILSKIAEKEKEVICKRFGLWDGKKETLFEVGEHLNLTRERIRQIEAKALRKIRHFFFSDKCLKLFLKKFFNNKLLPFLEKNYNIANQSELFQIIYALDGESIEFDLANEFLTTIIGSPIFSPYVINFDEEVIGLHKDDREFYVKLIKSTYEYLMEKKIPQSIDDIVRYFEKMQLTKDINLQKDRIKRFLLASDLARDSTGKFGLNKWRYFNSKTISGMAERALLEINEPAHFTQIVLLMNELFPDYGPFDAHNVHARIGRKDIFVWVAPGVYGLKLWGLERPPHVKDYLVKLLKKANRPMHVNELTEKVLEGCNCKRSSVVLTLNFDEGTFIKYPDKLYGLISWK